MRTQTKGESGGTGATGPAAGWGGSPEPREGCVGSRLPRGAAGVGAAGLGNGQLPGVGEGLTALEGGGSRIFSCPMVAASRDRTDQQMHTEGMEDSAWHQLAPQRRLPHPCPCSALGPLLPRLRAGAPPGMGRLDPLLSSHCAAEAQPHQSRIPRDVASGTSQGSPTAAPNHERLYAQGPEESSGS